MIMYNAITKMYVTGALLLYSLVAVQAVLQCWGYIGMSPAVAVQAPWDIARCMLTVVHHNAGIGMSGVVSCLCTICGCTIAGGCASGKGDCVSTTGMCWQHRVAITHCNTDIDMSGIGGLFMW